MRNFADYSRVNSAVNGQKGYASRLSGLSNTFSGNMNRLNGIAFDQIEKYGTVSEQDMVDQATTDNTLSYQKAYNTNLRNMERMGINPNSGRFQGMNQEYDLMRAAAEAGARNQARLNAREINFNRGMSIGQLGAQYGQMATSAASAAASAYDAYVGSRASLANSIEMAKYRPGADLDYSRSGGNGDGSNGGVSGNGTGDSAVARRNAFLEDNSSWTPRGSQWQTNGGTVYSTGSQLPAPSTLTYHGTRDYSYPAPSTLTFRGRRSEYY